MSSEDFPALPGTQNREGPSPGGSVSGDKTIPVGLGPEIGQDVLQANRAPGSEKSQSSKRGIQTSPDGKRPPLTPACRLQREMRAFITHD